MTDDLWVEVYDETHREDVAEHEHRTHERLVIWRVRKIIKGACRQVSFRNESEIIIYQFKKNIAKGVKSAALN